MVFRSELTYHEVEEILDTNYFDLKLIGYIFCHPDFMKFLILK